MDSIQASGEYQSGTASEDSLLLAVLCHMPDRWKTNTLCAVNGPPGLNPGQPVMFDASIKHEYSQTSLRIIPNE